MFNHRPSHGTTQAYAGSDPRFHYTAARYFLARGSLEGAANQLKTAAQAQAQAQAQANGGLGGLGGGSEWLGEAVGVAAAACATKLAELNKCCRLKDEAKAHYQGGRYGGESGRIRMNGNRVGVIFLLSLGPLCVRPTGRTCVRRTKRNRLYRQ